jgi:hypothetical protein
VSLPASSFSLVLAGRRGILYDKCKVEQGIGGKQPDILLTNSMTGEQLVVEIFYSHTMEKETLTVFQGKGLQVMEINISSMRKKFPSMQGFERMVLKMLGGSFCCACVSLRTSRPTGAVFQGPTTVGMVGGKLAVSGVFSHYGDYWLSCV